MTASLSISAKPLLRGRAPSQALQPFRIGHRPLPGGERSDRVRQQSIRVRGRYPFPFSSDQIVSRTSARLVNTASFVTRITRNPSASSSAVLLASRRVSAPVECVPPSTSTISLPASVTKSTTYRSIACWRLNFQRSSCRFRSPFHNRASADVSAARSCRALSLKRSTPSPARFARDLSPPGRGERLTLPRIYPSPTRSLLPFRIGHAPLPGGERSDRVRKQSIRVRGRSRGGRT